MQKENRWTTFAPPAAGLSRRYRGRILHRRSHTIEFKVNLLAPGKGERFLFRGSVTKPGRTIIVADGQAYAFVDDSEAKLIATMTGTMMTVVGRQGIEG